MSIPTRESCDPDDPRDAFTWAFVSLPFAPNQTFSPPPQISPEWSQHFWDLGFRHHPDLQVKKFVPPHRGPQHPLNATARWADLNEPDLDPVVIPDVSAYTPAEQSVIAAQLYETGLLTAPEPAIDKAEVASTFNPADHSPSTVNGYLMAVSDAERRRVISLEMTDKARDQILRKWRDV